MNETETTVQEPIEQPVVDNQSTAQETTEVVETPQFSDEQIQAYLKSKFNFEGDLTSLEEKLKYTPAPAEPSQEEITAKQREEDKRLLDFYLKNVKDGTIETFTAMKGLLQENDTELGRRAALKELMDDGFTKDQAEAELKVRYYQKELNELNEDDFDTTEEFEAEKAALQKKIDFGNKKLLNKSQYIKKTIEEQFNKLRAGIENEDLQKQKEIELSSKVDEHISKMPRKLTFELGETNGRKLDPITYDVSSADIEAIAAELKDPSKRNEIIFDKDGDVNVSTIAELKLRNKILESAIKASYLEGETRQVKAFESIYPARTAYQVGVGGVPQKQTTEPGKIVKVGKPRVAIPQS